MKARISRRLGFPLLLMFIGGFVAYGAFYWFLRKTAADTQVIEIAGTLELRAEQIGRLAYSLTLGYAWAEDPLFDAMKSFEEHLRILESGNLDAGGIVPPAAPALATPLSELTTVWGDTRELCVQIAELSADSVGSAETYDELRPLLPRLTESTQNVLQAYRSRIDSFRARMHSTLAVILLVDVILLIVGYWLIRRFVVRPIELIDNAATSLKAGDFSVRVPITTGDELGNLATTFNEASERIAFLLDETKRRESSLREISQRLLKTQDEERRRLARELHDGVSQILAALSMSLEMAKQSIKPTNSDALRKIDESESLVDETLGEIRTITYLLHPPMPGDVGFTIAMNSLVNGFSNRSGIEVTLQMQQDMDWLPEDVALTLFRIVQEAFNNILRHSKSPTALVELSKVGSAVVLRVRDQGKGMPPELLEPTLESSAQLGVGIGGMRERVRQLGGELDIASSGEGTVVEARIPLPRPPPVEGSDQQ